MFADIMPTYLLTDIYFLLIQFSSVINDILVLEVLDKLKSSIGSIQEYIV